MSTNIPGGGTCGAKWVQCGGQGWTGSTCCRSGSTCKLQNDCE
jgi:endo-1,4-beta-xylanase